jgi:hypothetical protein
MRRAVFQQQPRLIKKTSPYPRAEELVFIFLRQPLLLKDVTRMRLTNPIGRESSDEWSLDYRARSWTDAPIVALGTPVRSYSCVDASRWSKRPMN